MNTQEDKNLVKIGSVFRTLGTALLGASLVTFLLHGVYTLDSVGRYLSLSAFTAVLVGIGIFTVKKLADTKGARTYLGLATATVLTHFAQIGSFVWTLGNEVNKSIPGVFVFSGLDAAWIIPLALAAPIFLYPVAHLGFSALFRNRAKTLAITFVLTCSALMLPIRDAAMMLPIAIITLMGTIFIDLKYIAKDVYANSFDGRIARMLMLTAPSLLFVRSLFYDPTALYFTFLFTAISVVFYWVSTWEELKEGFRAMLRTTGLYLTGLSWMAFMASEISAPAACYYTLGAILLAGGRSTIRFEKFHTKFAILILGLTAFFDAITNLAFLNGFSATIVGALLIVYSVQARSREALFIGSISTLAAVASLSWVAFAQIHSQVWLSLAILGLAASVIASLADRYHKQMIHWYRATYEEEAETKIIVQSNNIEVCIENTKI